MKRILHLVLLAAALAAALPLHAQDVITISSTSVAPGGTARVGVWLRDVSGTPLGVDAGSGKRIQGVALSWQLASTGDVPAMQYETAGVLRAFAATYERLVAIDRGFAYLGYFDEASAPIPFVSNAASPGNRIGTIVLTVPAQAVNGTTYTLTLDPKYSRLANAQASIFESQFNGKLKLIAGTVIVGGAATATTITSSANPVNAGADVTFTAHVTSGAAGTIGGTVAFMDGPNTLGYANLVNGSASLTTSLAAGAHSITAVYEGSSAYQTSTSPVLSQTVNVSLTAPSGLSATATSTTNVALTWSAVANATTYEIRRAVDGGAFNVVGTTSATSYNDATVTANKAYVYAVRALGAGGATSPNSAKEIATTVMFNDDPVTTATPIRLAHLTQLRTAANALRASAGLAPAAFTDPSPASATRVKKVHIEELRTAIATARSLIGVAAAAFDGAPLVLVKAAHVQELRSAVK